jgi:serine/threonine protein kinase/tetratricopeptide (TPR) repeat protein
MGVVYEALDRETHRTVALKTLQRFDANSLYLFKQEFRALADVHHRNLVRLYELVQPEEGPLFFTMELIDGANFLDHVLGLGGGETGRITSSLSSSSASAATVTRSIRSRSEQPTLAPPPSLGDEPTRVDPDRLRPALRQLVQGLGALHAAGKLHRDIKPSNVLVTSAGRIVILDFGIAIELSRAASEAEQTRTAVVGTPAYVSPEQAAGEVPTAASDWYAVGVILYEALAGRRPFVGSSVDILTLKVTEDPPPPSTWARGIPADLEALCVDLLRQEPSERPDGAEILRRLGAIGSERPALGREVTSDEPIDLLVGRDEQVQAIRGAFERVVGGETVTVRVRGGAGMGKSTLVQRFLDDVQTSGEAEILCGRAYERESVPYKAVDSLMDSLTRLLVRIEEVEGPVATPRHASALAKLFPVVRRVPSLAALVDASVDDAHRVRRRAFGALRELVDTLARRRPLVLYIDDVQWGDVDSVALLHEVMRPPHAPPALLLLTYREEEAATSPFLLEMNECWADTADVRDVCVGPLGPDDVQRLALARIGASDEAAVRTALAVAREAKGSPFLVEELVRSNRVQTAKDATLSLLTLAEIVGHRLGRLPEGARRVAQVVAIAGRPLPISVVEAACGEDDVSDENVELLRSERLVRVGFREGSEVIEPSHDRIRETIVEQVPADHLRAHHGGLARALEAASSVDLEALAVHLIGSGARERGAACAERAAEQAESKLAFEQAARLYRVALETHPRGDDEARPIRIQVARALERAGRGAEAARAYLDAATSAPTLERVDLERAAAAQLLSAGHTDEGTEVLRRVLAAVGMRAPRTALGAILSLLLHRILLRFRGLAFEERSPEQIAPEDRVRVDALCTVAMGFSVVDVVLGACMQARFFRMALDVGDRSQVARAASIQITHLASQGGPIGKAEQSAYAIAERLAASLGDKDIETYFEICRGLTLYHRGRYKEARAALHSRTAMRQGREATAHGPLFGVYALFYLGRLREQARRATQLLEDAERRGDLYTAVNLRAAPLVDTCLIADDPDAAREHIRVALATWTQRGFHLQHWKAWVWGAQIELYVGDGGRAYARLESDYRAYRRSLIAHSQAVRALTAFIRGCAAVASAGNGAEELRRSRLKEARGIVRRLEREAMGWTAPLASLVRAATANAEGDAAGAAAALREAIDLATAADMSTHAWCARRQLGQLVGGEEGERLVAQADTAMRAEGVRAPARMATMFVPGRWGGAA